MSETLTTRTFPVSFDLSFLRRSTDLLNNSLCSAPQEQPPLQLKLQTDFDKPPSPGATPLAAESAAVTRVVPSYPEFVV